jgi:hypothetical protein
MSKTMKTYWKDDTTHALWFDNFSWYDNNSALLTDNVSEYDINNATSTDNDMNSIIYLGNQLIIPSDNWNTSPSPVSQHVVLYLEI